MKTLFIDPALLTPTVMHRFWSKTEAVENGCMEWRGARTRVGYGYFYVAGTVYRAHRVSLTHTSGESIPDGLDVDHLCHNPGCVRPDHLEAVDRRTNIARSTAGAASAVSGQLCQREHDLTAPDAWGVNQRGDRYCRQCANQRWREWNQRRSA